jgi:hypothetical protein
MAGGGNVLPDMFLGVLDLDAEEPVGQSRIGGWELGDEEVDWQFR